MGTRLVFDGRQVARQVHDSQVSAQRRPTMDQQVERLARQRGISQEAAEEAYAHLPNYDAIAAAGPDIPVGCCWSRMMESI